MTRPGGWVEGIGWVALLCDLAEGDQYDWCEHAAVRDAGTVPLRTPIVVTRWADGTTPMPERGWAIHEPDEFRPRLEAGETTCPEGTCAGCPDPDACAALRPAPIPATEGRQEDDEAVRTVAMAIMLVRHLRHPTPAFAATWEAKADEFLAKYDPEFVASVDPGTAGQRFMVRDSDGPCAPIPATEGRREDATVKLPWVVHDAVEEDWYCFATEAEAVKKAQAIIDFYGGDSWPGAIDEITVMQVTHAPVETVLFEREGMTDDEWYEATEDDGDHDMWVNYSVRPVASPSAGTVQPDPEGLVVLRRSDVEALCEEWADLDEDPFWRPQPLPELLTLARDAVEACARNIAETGEWGIDALNKARAALAALGSSEGEDER